MQNKYMELLNKELGYIIKEGYEESLEDLYKKAVKENNRCIVYTGE